MLTVSAIAALAAILAPCAQGHGWITSPMSRALCDGRDWEGIFMPGGGNGAGPGMHDLGGVPGVCGDPFQSMTDIRTNFAEDPCSIQETYTEGSEVTVVVELSNQHGGYFEFAICPMATGLTEDCFAQNIMMTESGAQQYWAQPTEKSSSISVDNREVYNVKVQLPPGLTCEHCTLMWTWWTSHMCTYDCDEQICGAYANFNNPMPTGGSGPPCASDKPSKGQTPQMFRACGDVAILPAGGGPAPPRPTTPTTTPETPEEMPKEPEMPEEMPEEEPEEMPITAPTQPAAAGACGGMSQPVCTDLTGRQYECDHGYIGMNGYCVPYTPPTAAQMPAGDCGGDQQPVCTDFSVRVYECDFGFVGKAGICVPYVMGESASPTTTPPADPQIKNVVEEEEEKETMPTPPTTTPTAKCGGLGNAACTDGEPCNAGLIPITGGASTICRKDTGQGRKLSAPMN